MQTYQTLSTGSRLVAVGAGIVCSAIVLTAALLPFGLDGPQHGTAVVAREAALRAARTAAASAPDASSNIAAARSY